MKLHTNRKHSNLNEENQPAKFTIEEVLKVFISLSETILQDKLFPDFILVEVTKFKTQSVEENPTLIKSIQKLIKTVINECSFKSEGKFLKAFYDNIVPNSEVLFPTLSSKASTIVARKFGEHIFGIHKRKQLNEPDEIRTKNLDNKELAGLQYLGGYVLKNI